MREISFQSGGGEWEEEEGREELNARGIRSAKGDTSNTTCFRGHT